MLSVKLHIHQYICTYVYILHTHTHTHMDMLMYVCVHHESSLMTQKIFILYNKYSFNIISFANALNLTYLHWSFYWTLYSEKFQKITTCQASNTHLSACVFVCTYVCSESNNSQWYIINWHITSASKNVCVCGIS